MATKKAGILTRIDDAVPKRHLRHEEVIEMEFSFRPRIALTERCESVSINNVGIPRLAASHERDIMQRTRHKKMRMLRRYILLTRGRPAHMEIPPKIVPGGSSPQTLTAKQSGASS